jgi:hypothetical protein
MNVHVNLLHDDERRYQGLVSRKFIILASAGTVVSILVLLGSLAGYSFFGERQEWSTLRTQWQQTEPRYKNYLSQQQGQGRVKAVVGELNGWNRGRLPLSAILLDVQRMVAPHPIQLTRITIMGESTFVQPPTPKVPPAAATNAPPAKPPPPIPARLWRVTIMGRVFGPQGHSDVVALTTQLQNAPGLADVWESVRLQNLTRATGSERRDEQNFTIEGLTKMRKCE